jgi:hypothetical protein
MFNPNPRISVSRLLPFSFQITPIAGSMLVPRPEEGSSSKLAVWKLPLNSDYVDIHTLLVL